MLRCIVKIGQIYIAFEVLALSIYLAFPRTWHLVQALHIFKYLEINIVNDLDFNPCYQHVTSDQDIHSKFQVMKYFYVDAGEKIHQMPQNQDEN